MSLVDHSQDIVLDYPWESVFNAIETAIPKLKGFFCSGGMFYLQCSFLAWSVGHWYQDSPFLGLAVNDFCPEKRRSGSGG